MECASCGSQNLPVALFCGRCGQPLARAPSPETVPADSPGHDAAPAAHQPVVSSPRHRAPSSLFRGLEAGLWQRVVMGLAALVLVAPVALGLGFLDDYDRRDLNLYSWGVPLAAVGLGLGLAAVRPPSGVLRRILVALGALVISVVVAAAIIAGFLFASYYY